MVIFLKQFKNNQSTNMLLDLGCEQTDSKCKNCKVRSTHDSENLGTQKQQQDHFKVPNHSPKNKNVAVQTDSPNK